MGRAIIGASRIAATAVDGAAKGAKGVAKMGASRMLEIAVFRGFTGDNAGMVSAKNGVSHMAATVVVGGVGGVIGLASKG